MPQNSAEIHRLQSIVQAFRRVTVTVLGDLVADEFVLGEISRVSREAPVLILKRREKTIVPGGGANAIYNLADLGVKVLPVGVVGDDEAGHSLLQQFRKKQIALSGISVEKKYNTVTKTRILAGMAHAWPQQVVRIDREPSEELGRPLEGKLSAAARKCVRSSAALLVSDYGYGAASPNVLKMVLAKKTFKKFPVTLDSRYRMLEFSNITAATPNEAEVEAALQTRIGQNWKKLTSAGTEIIRRMKLESLVITRGRDGMAALVGRNKSLDIPSFGSDEVTDVTGAGDTVIATFTAALATGASAEDAARLANFAGGIVVMKRGTATVSQQELLSAIGQSLPSERSRSHSGKTL
jgi:rfaE bifunctional protein kinase chain/domain